MTETLTRCFHCGQPCEDETYKIADKQFCCNGCKLVYELLEENNLCQYYEIESHPGRQAISDKRAEYDHLDNPAVAKTLLEFDSPEFARVRFRVPAIHCASCIWLLENMRKLDSGVIRSEVTFGRKEVSIDYNPAQTSLSQLAATLDALGYAPVVNTEKQEAKKQSPRLVLKLGIAGFAFGNVMLFSFPEYLGLDPNNEALGRVFSWLNIILSIPVFFYSAEEYFRSALKSFRQSQLNIDVPIALGLLALFLRSTFDIVTGYGPGYLDSFTGLVFFLLIGRWFQSRTYESLSFDRDFKSYFPLAVQRLVDGSLVSTVIYELKKGDTIRIRNLEIIPADSILLDKVAFIDYSFVTGEAKPVKAVAGNLIYAGGRLIGQPVKLIIEKETSQSHLTSLWNNDAFRKKHESKYRKIIDQSARVFTWIVLGIALVTAVYWYFAAPDQMWLVLTSVLMVACPCALALAAPFTYGSMLRVFGRHQFYLKNADVIERMAAVNAVVFDKTGTVTHGQNPLVEFEGKMSIEDFAAVKLLTSYSTHPLSNLINKAIPQKASGTAIDFTEKPGKGVAATINGRYYRVGSAQFAGLSYPIQAKGTSVVVAVDEELKGYFVIRPSIRSNMKNMLSRLGDRCKGLLSGDNTSDETAMRNVFPAGAKLLFNLQPSDKMDHIASLQANGSKVMMIGDGLNDAGALKQAGVGIAVTDDTGLFTPGCDGIVQGTQVHQLDRFLALARASTRILRIAFTISFLYNAVALTFAVTGHLTPLVAAILMPLSSISVVGFASIGVHLAAKRMLNKENQ